MLNMLFIDDLHLLTVDDPVEFLVNRKAKSKKVDHLTGKNKLQVLKKAVVFSAFTALHKRGSYKHACHKVN